MRQYLIEMIVVLVLIVALCADAGAANPHVVLSTNLGDITIELYPQAAPITVDNFLFYVNTRFYDNLLFHRAIWGFMIQGGGYYLDGYNIISKTPTAGAIVNESYNGLRNLRGTIAMARTNLPHSATSQFFINHVDNPHLDRANASDGYGYCVFGRVVNGLDVVDAIAEVPTFYVSPSLANFPGDPPVVMSQVRVLPAESSYDSNFHDDSFIDFSDFAMFASNWFADDCRSANVFCSGKDLNYSGQVNVIDLELFIQHWNRTVGYEPAASDMNADGLVNLEDAIYMAERWLNSGCSAANDYCGGCDIDRSRAVDMGDFGLFSSNWLLNY